MPKGRLPAITRMRIIDFETISKRAMIPLTKDSPAVASTVAWSEPLAADTFHAFLNQIRHKYQ
ncbi:MAG: hypothetical protein DWI25_02665, partial [Planctomycetota bacterium]